MAYRFADAVCPACQCRLDDEEQTLTLTHAAGDFWARRCPRCRGIFVDEATLGSIFRALKPDATPPELMEHQDTTGVLRCPECRILLRRVWLDFLSLERCPLGHGVWFEGNKLVLAARHVGEGPLVTKAEVAALTKRAQRR